MDKALRSRAVVVGHLTITAPAMAAILLVPFLGLRTLGPFLFVYYVVAGVTLGWQWYSVALPSWRKYLVRKGVQDEEVDEIARRAGLVWPGEATIGPFALHTTAAVVCGIHVGPWLVSRWFAWILPLAGISPGITGDEYLQHFELASVVPAFVAGYALYRHVRRLATCAWILPTVVFVYKLLTFTEPFASILVAHPLTRFSYFFVIQRSMPTLTPGFGGIDPVRVVQQMVVVAPFYAGLAYSIGALAARNNLLKKLFGYSPTMQEITETEQPPETNVEDDARKTHP